MATKVAAEVERVKRSTVIRVDFGYDQAFVAAVKGINGRRFVGREDGGPFWTVPLTLESCYALRESFGPALSIGQELKAWAWREVRRSREMTALAGAEDAELTNLPEVAPRLAEALHGYQRAGVAFLANGGLCADEPGLGKTLEAIGAIHEAGLHDGPNLIVAPKTSLDVVWETELGKWQDEPVYVLPEGKEKRLKVLEAFRTEVVEAGLSGWLVINPASVRQSYPVLHEVEWNSVTIDECHVEGLRNPRSSTAKAMSKLKVRNGGLRIALSGTPMAGKPIQLWGILHWLRPETFGSKWAWAREWLEMNNNGFGTEIGDVVPERREAFDRALTPYVLRRTKGEVYKELPPKQYVDLWLPLSGRQATQYREMAKDAMAKLSEADVVTANGVLAEFTRLKQFATAAWEMGEAGKLTPTGVSNKLDQVTELLAERGITGDDDEEGTSQVVIFSQFTEVVEMVVRELNAKGIETLSITGKVKGAARKEAQESFQGDGGPRVLVMNVKAGGVAITLDRADTVIMLDEWWAPDVMTQAEDRVHRVSRIHQVTVYYLRSKDTVEEYIMGLVDEKGNLDRSIMDDRRKLLGLIKGEVAA